MWENDCIKNCISDIFPKLEYFWSIPIRIQAVLEDMLDCYDTANNFTGTDDVYQVG